MAILWRRLYSGTEYEVRSAGRTIRLYSNGVLHTQFNPAQAVTGNIWDLLFLPALFLPADSVKRVLVLGVGGGAVIRLLLRYVAPVEITGVELSAVHIQIARRFFAVDKKVARLVCADASEWVDEYSGEAFDLVIDDLFMHVNAEPERAIAVDRAWAKKLLSLVKPQGILIVNFESSRQMKQSALICERKMREQLETVLMMKGPQNENTVGVFSRSEFTSQTLRQKVRMIPALTAGKKTTGLRYTVRKLKN
ncbi:MAG: class I SAM-dependent methyltransferase [Gammaproteobacteria bacterium]